MPPVTSVASAASPPPARGLAPYRPIALDDLVRVGRDHDGGYVISRRTCDATRLLVGLGINDDWSFETAFVAANPAVRVVGVDGSVSPAHFRRRAARRFATALPAAIAGAARARRSVVLTELAPARRELALARDMARFFDGRPHRFVPRFLGPRDDARTVSWATIAAAEGIRRDGPCDVFVKMDIEGSEYDVLPALLADAPRLAGLVVEFHALGAEWARFTAVMRALDAAFVVAHVHGNNHEPYIPGTDVPDVLELSFVNRRLVDGPGTPDAGPFPRPGLDMPNAWWLADYPLVF